MQPFGECYYYLSSGNDTDNVTDNVTKITEIRGALKHGNAEIRKFCNMGTPRRSGET